MILSVLIPTLPERRKKLNAVLASLPDHRDVEVLIDDRGREVPTGTKRNALMRSARGGWTVYVDDDDLLSPEYMPSILNALKHDPDVVTFQGLMTTDGINPVAWTIKLGERYEARGNHYYRFPNHLCPMRRDLVKDVRFPDTWNGEDYPWAKEIMERGILKTEVHIEKQLYHYDFLTRK